MLTFPRLFVSIVVLIVQVVRVLARSRTDLVLENLSLRQQVTALKRERPRPYLDDVDRGVLVALRKSWAGWATRLSIVTPQTVVKWHRRRFRRYWTRLSHENRRPGRPRLTADAIAAMDFFTVPTIRLRVLYCFFVIGHGRRRVVHFNATFNPTSAWAIQQLREAFPFDAAPGYLIFDRDAIFGAAVVAFVKAMGTKPSRTAFRSPWQNPIAERWIGSCRRELFDHVIVFGECHAVGLVQEYIAYHHQDRTHLGLAKDTPDGRAVTPRPSGQAKVVALPRVGGLHHRYEWREAA